MSDTERERPGFVPPGSQVLTPYICPRDAARAIDWYVEIFGAVESGSRFVDPSGRVGHAEVLLGDAQLMLSDAYPDYGAVAPEEGNQTATFALQLYVPDVDEVTARAEAAGAVIQRPPADQAAEGFRQATLVDPFGVRWMIATHRRTVSAEDLAAAAAAYAVTGHEPGPLGSQA